MLTVFASFRLPLESVAEARPLMIPVIEGTQAEPGCQSYTLAEDVAEPGLFRVAEVWDSREALKAHFETAHMKLWIEQRTKLGFYDRQVSLYEATPAEL